MAGDPEEPQQGDGVLHLGEVRVGESPQRSAVEPPVTHRSRRWAIMVAVFLAGAMVGSYAWFARSDLVGSAHVELIVTDVKHDAPLSDGTMNRVSVVVRNIGGDDVTIIAANLPGKPDGDRGSDEVTIPAGQTRAVALDGELNCGTGLPDVIEADVRTPAGKTSAELPAPTTVGAFAFFCRSPDEVWVDNMSEPGVAIESGDWADGLSVVLPLGIRSWGVPEVEITDVAVSAGPGFDAEPSGLVGRHDTRTIAELRVEWTVADCGSRYLGEPIDITFTFADHPPATVQAPETLQYTLVTVMDEVCGS